MSELKKIPLYVCDRKQCSECHPECFHTADITHAANFKVVEAPDYETHETVQYYVEDYEE